MKKTNKKGIILVLCIILIGSGVILLLPNQDNNKVTLSQYMEAPPLTYEFMNVYPFKAKVLKIEKSMLQPIPEGGSYDQRTVFIDITLLAEDGTEVIATIGSQPEQIEVGQTYTFPDCLSE